MRVASVMRAGKRLPGSTRASVSTRSRSTSTASGYLSADGLVADLAEPRTTRVGTRGSGGPVRVALDPGEQQFRGAAPDLPDVLADYRQRRRHEVGEGEVVEADQGDLVLGPRRWRQRIAATVMLFCAANRAVGGFGPSSIASTATSAALLGSRSWAVSSGRSRIAAEDIGPGVPLEAFARRADPGEVAEVRDPPMAVVSEVGDRDGRPTGVVRDEAASVSTPVGTPVDEDHEASRTSRSR